MSKLRIYINFILCIMYVFSLIHILWETMRKENFKFL